MKMSRSGSWRDLLPIHPAAALFPRMSSDERRELGKDIRKNGLRCSIALRQSDIPGAFIPNNWTWRPPKARSRQADLFDGSAP